MNTSAPSVETILAQAVEIAEPADRQAFVEQVCGGNAELQRRVERLIDNHFQAGSFLEKPAAALDLNATTGWETTGVVADVGTVIGPYKLLEQIGEGGMGLVFVAEQQQPIKRRVALKIIKPGMDTRQVIARFEAERQALALMDHPNIAKVHDAGATSGEPGCVSAGRPYFVMELVKGIPITDYCDTHRLSTRQRLELFLDVCRAVQHAHQKGIIHRDLKPSNVLVEVHDVRPVVKVIDFGIAKATGQQLTDKSLYTAVSQLVGTPLYMSPEQAGLSSLDVDTRSDVYSLGVVLYELLTGTTPFSNFALQKAGYDEMRRIIREDEPPRPSTRLCTMGQAALSTIAERRGLEPRRLSQQLRGELDWIVMKALEKDRNRRYESTGAFAADVQRYLDDEPVLACPPSRLYRLGKFARRHKAGLSVAALLLAALLLGGRSWLWWMQKRAGAEREAQVALQEVSELLNAERWSEALSAARRAGSVLSGVGADADLRRQVQSLIEDVEMARRLQEARLHILVVKDGRLHSGAAAMAYAEAFREYGLDLDRLDPDMTAKQIRSRPILRHLVAALDHWAFLLINLKAEGWQQPLAVARAADPDPWRNRLRDGLEKKDPKAVAEFLAAGVEDEWLAETLILLVPLAIGTPTAERVAVLLARAQKRHPNSFWINIYLTQLLAASRPRRLEEEIRFASVAVALKPQSPGAHLKLGNSLTVKGQLDEAIAEYQEAIRLNKDFADAHMYLGLALKYKGQTDAAIAEYQEAIRLNKDFAEARMYLGVALAHKGRFDDAISECREAIRLKEDFDQAHCNLGLCLANKGQLDAAIAEYREAIRINENFAEAHINLGVALATKGQLDGAIAEFRAVVRLKEFDAEAHHNLGSALASKGQLDEAVTEYREAIRIKRDYADAHNNLGIVLRDKGQVDEAMAEYREAIRINKGYAPAHNSLAWLLATCPDLKRRDTAKAVAHAKKAVELAPGNGAMWNTLGVAQYRNGDWKAAIEALMKSTQLSEGGESTDFFFLAMAHRQLNDKDKARAWYEKAVAWMDKHNPKDAELKRFRDEATALLGLPQATDKPKKKD